MDDQSRDLVLELAARAGMLLEDVSATLILLPSEKPDQIQRVIESSSSQLESAIELLRSALTQIE